MSGFPPSVNTFEMNSNSLSLEQLRAIMSAHGVRRILAKFLSPNDNSKNQIYLGGDADIVNIVPAGDLVASSGKHDEPIFKAAMQLSWLDNEGRAFNAPNAQLILYPQYPEVRMSGFLRGSQWSPNDVLTVRDEGRILLLGITNTNRILAYASSSNTPLANELRTLSNTESLGVFRIIPLTAQSRAQDSRIRLLAELCKISKRDWIDGWTLGIDGSRRACTASNCVGVTLESELGITANGRSEPDFDGWEVKGHTVANLSKPGSGAVTLMTPEPNGGFYSTDGAIAFVRRFGYADKKGRDDRINFGGIHRVGEVCNATGLTLELQGYDVAGKTLMRSDGQLALVDQTGTVAASWNFAGLLSHWKRKHSQAAFVPALKRTEPNVGFKYGSSVLLAEGTDYLRMLAALADGTVYYDPGIKVENASTKPRAKKRSQFRVSRANLNLLYHSSEHRESCDA